MGAVELFSESKSTLKYVLLHQLKLTCVNIGASRTNLAVGTLSLAQCRAIRVHDG